METPSCAREEEIPGKGDHDGNGGWARAEHGGASRQEKTEKREIVRGIGFYIAVAGAPDALKLAPNTLGAHRTRAQRVLKLAQSPDTGHRTLT